jgi:hypothetical protein
LPSSGALCVNRACCQLVSFMTGIPEW